MDEPQPQPFREVLLIQALVATLVAIAFGASFLIWRVTFESIFFTLIADRFVARFVLMFSQVAMAFLVVLLMLAGDPWLRRAMRQGRLWPLFWKIVGGLLLFGVAGVLLGMAFGTA